MVVKKNPKNINIPQVHLTNGDDVRAFVDREVDLKNCERGSLSILSFDNQFKLVGMHRVSVSDLLEQRGEILAGILLTNGSRIIVADNYEHIETSKQFLNMFLDVTSTVDFEMVDYINITSGISLSSEIRNKIVYTEKYNNKYAPIELESKYIQSNLHLVEDGGLEVSELTKEAAISALTKELSEFDTEYLCVLSLDKEDIPINYNLISKGTLSETLADIKTALKAPILSGAEKVILMHNHTSYGIPTPSKEDTETTFRLNNAFNMCGIKLEDHIIASTLGSYSYEKSGKLEEIKERRFTPNRFTMRVREVDDISIGDKIATELSDNTTIIDIKESRLGDSKEAILFDGRQYITAKDIRYNMSEEKYEWNQGYYFDNLAKAVAVLHTDDKSVESVLGIYSEMNFQGFFKALVKSEMQVNDEEMIDEAFQKFMKDDESTSLISDSIRENIEDKIVKEYTCESKAQELDYGEDEDIDDEMDFD